MENHDVIREKLDIKLVILFILRRLPEACYPETLANLVLSDAGVGYFEYAECLGELIDAGHIEQLFTGFRITEKGDRNCAIVESSLPYTIRTRLGRLLEPIAASMRRQSMIGASHDMGEDGCRVELSLSDGVGKILELRLLCGGEQQAARIEQHFRADAEKLYTRIVELLDAKE